MNRNAAFTPHTSTVRSVPVTRTRNTNRTKFVDTVTVLDIGSGGGERDQLHVQLVGDILHFDLDKNAVHLETRGDAHMLPFKDKSFHTIHASHILEHLQYPTIALREWARVARDRVVIQVPNVVSHYGTAHPAHLYNWNVWTLKQLCSLVFSRVQVKGTSRYLVNHDDPFLKKFLVFWVTLPLRLQKNQLTAVCTP